MVETEGWYQTTYYEDACLLRQTVSGIALARLCLNSQLAPRINGIVTFISV